MAVDCANPLLLGFLKEFWDVAKQSSSKGATTYKKAYESMKACPLTFNHPSEAQQLHGLGPKLCDRLTAKLEAYCAANGLPKPKVSRKSRKRLSADDLSLVNPPPLAKKSRKPKTYVPTLRSGPYAIIIALSSLPEESATGLTKAQIIEKAQEHCDSSFTAHTDTSKFYTAWSSMKTLEDKDMVYEKGRPLRRYYLTDEGWEVAKRIKNVQGGDKPPSDAEATGLLSNILAVDRSTGSALPSFEHLADLNRPRLPLKTSTTPDERGQTTSNELGWRLGGVEGDKFGTVANPQARHTPSNPDFVEILSSPEPSSCPQADVGEMQSMLSSRGKISNRDPGRARDIRPLKDPHVLPTFQPIKLQPGTFTIQLVLDSREVRAKNDRDYIHDELAKKGINALVRALELGDFFWVAKCKDPGLLARFGEEGDEVALDWIIERKRLDDLVGSIKDGRFHEQKFRLRKSGVKNVVYIIEDYSLSSERITQFHEAIVSAIATTQVVDGYTVKKTLKLDDTIRYLARMTLMLKNIYEFKTLHIIPATHLQPDTYMPLLSRLRVTTPQISYNITYTAFASLASKSDSLTLRDVFLKMLMCTRGITGDKALELQQCWKTPRAFFEALEGCGGKQEREAMLEARVGGKYGRKKIGKVVCGKVGETWGER